MRRLGAIVLTTLLVGCGNSGLAELERETLMALDRQFNDATAAHGAEGWASFFAEGGVMFRPLETIEGREAIEAFMAPAFEDPSFSLTWDPAAAEVALARDLGFTYGRYQSRRAGPHGMQVVGRGWYLTVWRKQSDGEWKVLADIGNPDGPPDTVAVEMP